MSRRVLAFCALALAAVYQVGRAEAQTVVQRATTSVATASPSTPSPSVATAQAVGVSGVGTAPATAASVSAATAATASTGGTATRAPALPPSAVAAAPSSLNFGSVWNGDPGVRKQFTISAVPYAGMMSVAIAGKSPFHIVAVRVWGDPPQGLNSVALASAATTSGSVTAAPSLARATNPTTFTTSGTTLAGAATSPDSTSSAKAIGKVLKVALFAPPFTTKVAAGDRVVVTVQFAPVFSLSQENAGPKSAKVTVTSTRWKSEVALAGTFNGLKLGMGLAAQPSTLYAPMQSYTPGQKLPAWPTTAQLSVVNATGSPQTVQFSGETNGAGIDVQPQGASFGVGQSQFVPFVVTWTPGTTKTGDYNVVAKFGTSTSTVGYHLQIVPTHRSFTAKGSGWSVTATVTATGEQRFSTQCFVGNMGQTAHDCTFYVYMNGQKMASTVSRADVLGPSNDAKSWTTQTGLTAEEAYQRMQAAWSCVEIDARSGDPNQYSQIPLDPESP